MVRLEAEKNKDKRLLIIEKLLAKEHTFLKTIKKYRDIKLLSSQDEMDEHGVIKIQAKDGDNQSLLQILKDDITIQNLAPDMIIDTKTTPYIRISFTL